MEELSKENNSEIANILLQNFLVDHQIDFLSKNYELIKPFDSNLLSGCSYDLRVGSILSSRNLESTFNLDSGYIIQSGECITIETLEEVDFRKILLFGMIANKHTILAKGLFHPITTIDPGFNGKLAITFINIGNIGYKIKKGDKIAKLIFCPVYPEPKNIYGVTQNPSCGIGSTDIALIYDKPRKPISDLDMISMCGEPVKKLYDKFRELNSKFETVESRIKIADFEKEARMQENRKIIYWTIISALISGASGALLAIYWTDIIKYINI